MNKQYDTIIIGAGIIGAAIAFDNDGILGAAANPFGDPFMIRVPRLAKKIAAGAERYRSIAILYLYCERIYGEQFQFFYQCPGNADALFLSAGQPTAKFSDGRIESGGKTLDKIVGIGGLGRFDDRIGDGADVTG